MVDKIELYKSDAISSKDEDVLGRTPFIEAVVNFIVSQSTEVNKKDNKQLRNLGDPLTIGIYGKWGYGKTSVINCVKAELGKKFFTAHFNPWMYNSDEDLIKHLFETIISSVSGAKNATKRKKLTKAVGKYFLHFVKGIKIDARVGDPKVAQLGAAYDMKNITDAIEKDLFQEETIYEVKKQINDVLKSPSNPIVIFIDDIDRLSKSEVYILFKTVRLIADFKNIIYVLSFDDEMVAKSIKSNFADGKDSDGYNYLEKIIDMPLRLPEIDHHSLNNYFREKLGLQVYVKEEDITEFHRQLHTISHYLLESPRDCIRITNSVRFVISNLGEDIDFEDIVLIESIRVKSQVLFGFVERYYKYMVVNNDPLYYGNRFNSPTILEKEFGVHGITNKAIKIWQDFFRKLFRVDIIDSSKIEIMDSNGTLTTNETFENDSLILNDNSNKIYNPRKLEQYLKLWNNF